ncbi:MAG: thioredoxin TrxC [Gemmatimonadaceae bacterium]
MDATIERTLTLRCQFCATWNRIDAKRAADRPKCGKCGTPMVLDRPVKLDDDTFARTIQEAQVPVLVDFYADWCGPCKMMAPFVDELAAQYQGQALVAKVDTDRAHQATAPFGIRSIPTSIVFRDGKEVARTVGAMPKAGLEELLKQALG